MTHPITLRTLGEYHDLMRLPKPLHPLISVVDFRDVKRGAAHESVHMIIPFYSIALKRNFNARMRYGQQDYDFDSGLMTFMAPGQVLSIEMSSEEALRHSGWLLMIHPDFLWNYPLASKISQYEYFGYRVHEALHLSDKEEATVKALIENIVQEYSTAIDKFSQDVIVAQLELLLTYAERFYQRQFITRKISNHRILERLEGILNARFNDKDLAEQGIPTVQFVADELNVSVNYLSGLLKTLTGQNTQQHIHHKLIDKAKEKLSTTQLSVSEIAFMLGFEHSQSFSKMFRSKTNLTPSEFRRSFN